jgi:hypothetical protein
VMDRRPSGAPAASSLIYPGGTPSRSARSTRMTNLLAQAIDCDDPDQAARIIRDALGIESDDVVKLLLPNDLAD